MKYTGRITLLALVIGSSIIFIYYYYSLNQEIKPIEIYLKIPFLFLSWYFGKKYDEAKFYSEKDALTEIYNRRFVYKLFPKLQAFIDREHEKLCVFVIDIDNFKAINDTYGHEMGDKVIQLISTSLIKNTRKTDIVARWGGDEFILMAPYSDEISPSHIVDRIENDIDQACEKLGIKVSIAVGMSTYPNQAKDLDELVKIADKNMYEVKLLKKAFN